MKNILLLTIFVIFSQHLQAQEISAPDSIAIILKPYENTDYPLSRDYFIRKSLIDSNFKLPFFLITDSLSVSSIISLLSSSEDVIKNLDYNDNQQLYSLKRQPNGEFDLRKGFTIDDTMDIYGMIALFRSGNYEFIWIGKDEAEIGRERWRHPNIYAKIKDFIDINFDYDTPSE